MKYFMGIIIPMVLFWSAPVFGQTTFAIKGGWNLTNFGGYVGYFGSPRTGVKIGASVTVPIHSRLGLQISGDYVPKGGNAAFYYEGTKTYIDYIEFSGLATFTLIAPRHLPVFSILIGPTAAFKIRTNGSEAFARRYWKDEFEFKTIDFGIAGGIGTEIAISKRVTFKAELVLTQSVSAVNKTTIYDSNSGNEKVNLTNRGISLCAGIGFPYVRRD